ncbi:LytTR family transcriptional regulator [Paenibacillus spiritus]|uniref:LytTR family transcriptional regulator n=1 Tax=Paenibacillus spiritus TaxID=2496557 RepID=A0A5J5GH49_9BACL|nr:LytTR family DNA-binding domain-containing protein [Paenibacillus spiritus]KAA9007465.1 LytTR family transcriptional regulator [Paenibacillus spiritus]
MRVLQKNGSSHEIHENEILYFSNFKNTIIVHTQEGEYVLPTTLSDLHAAYGSKGFERLDRSNVVNLDNVGDYDSVRKVVNFRTAPSFASVSESNESRLKKYLASRKSPQSSSSLSTVLPDL